MTHSVPARRSSDRAGDSLHALAFEWLIDPATHTDPFVRGELARELARAAGPAGMAGGQMMDLAAESANFDLPTVTRTQQLKTAALIDRKSTHLNSSHSSAILMPSSDCKKKNNNTNHKNWLPDHNIQTNRHDKRD